jgi:hypothetical protein
MNFLLNNQENFQPNSSIHSTDTAISTTCIDQMPTYLVFKKVHSMPVSEFSTDSLISLISLKNENTKFKLALRKYLNTHSFYSVDEFFMYEDGS